MNTPNSTATEIVERINSLDANEIVADYLAFDFDCVPGTYTAFVLDPSTGEIHRVNEPSRCCSTDEYFNESGALSRVTLISGTRSHWNPSPDDGFLWEYCPRVDATHFSPKDQTTRWKVIGEWNCDDDEACYDFFRVSDQPVDGWSDEYRAGEVREILNSVVKRIKAAHFSPPA